MAEPVRDADLVRLCRAVDWDEVLSCISFTEQDWVGAADVSNLGPLYDAVAAIQAHIDGGEIGD